MRSAGLLLILVYAVYNVTYYTALIHKNIYSLAWAPGAFLVSWLLLLTESRRPFWQKIIHAVMVCTVALPSAKLFFSFIFTGHLAGVDGYLVSDTLFVGLSYGALLLLKKRHHFISGEMQTHTRYLLNYFSLVIVGLTVAFISAMPVRIFSDLSSGQVQQLFLGSLLAFILYGVPVYFLWMNRFSFHLRMYQGQAMLSALMLLSVFLLPQINTSVFNWLLWGGMFLTLLWRSAWCQIVVFGLWGPLITQEFALKDKSLTDYGSMLFVIISTQILWLLFLHGDLLYERLRKQIESQTRILNTDPLTGCLNRRGFFSVCQSLIRKAPSLTIGILDINRFKAINDTLGHDAGDRVLQIVANRLAGCMGGKTRVSRPGGDEFAFVLPGDEVAARKKCKLFFSQLSERPIVISGQLIYVGVSLGFSRFPRDGREPEHLLHCADIAMYRAKRQRLQECVMYESFMDADRHGASDAAFFPHAPSGVIPACYAVFHPVYDVRKDRIHSVEALIRHPDISTIELVSWAEQSGRLDEMLERMLTLTLPVIRELSLPVSLNVSPTQLLSPEKLIQHLTPALSQGGLSLQVSLEITETVAITDAEQFQRALAQLKSHGFKISLDDFGSGFAFFETLNIGCFDIIKLDRGLICDIHRTPKKQYLVQSIIHYAEGLGITVIAEGVETKGEADFLLSLGICYMQGYYFSPPLEWVALCELYDKNVTLNVQ